MSRPGRWRASELADVMAYMEQRRDNAATIAANTPAHDELAQLAADRRRQLDVQLDDLRAGLHVGSAAVLDRALAGRVAA